MQAPVSLSLKGLSLSFKNTKLLENFNLEIPAGEFVSLLGPSGCGKSTLLRLIAGLTKPTLGRLEHSHVENIFYKSFVFQDANLLPWRTVRENLALPLELTGETANIAEVLELVGLSEHADKYPNQLSGGMRMRVSVGRALITQPGLLLLDEPFSALDENTRFRLQEELYAIWQKQKMTVVFVTHSMSEAVFLSERAIVLGAHFQATQIVLDHRMRLPDQRNADLRTDVGFIDEIKILSQSFAARDTRGIR